MNLRTCQYFLTICETGSFNAAARKLYISPQSLNERILKLEKKLDVQLFHRDTPLTLTPAGELMKLTAEKVVDALLQFEKELATLKIGENRTVTISFADHGIPPFFPLIVEEFLKQSPSTLLKTQKILSTGPIQQDVSLVISGTELGSNFHHECLLADELVISIADELLERLYTNDWQERKKRLQEGDLSAIEGCPFVHQTDARIDRWVNASFSAANYMPHFLPLHGSDDVLGNLCQRGQAAMITFRGVATHLHHPIPSYSLPHIPRDIPSCYICYPTNKPLTHPEQEFLRICRQVLRHLPESII